MFINSQVVDHVLFPAEHKINSKITQKSWQILGWFLLKNLPIPAYSIYRTCGKFNTPIKRRFLARIAHAKPDKIAENGYKMCTYKSLQKFSKNRNDLKTFSLNHLQVIFRKIMTKITKKRKDLKFCNDLPCNDLQISTVTIIEYYISTWFDQ